MLIGVLNLAIIQVLMASGFKFDVIIGRITKDCLDLPHKELDNS